jgi:hypothetical protein
MNCPDSEEEFLKVGITENGVKERFSYGKTKVIDSHDLTLKEKLEKSFSGEKYVSDFPYSVTEIHTVSYKYKGDAILAEEALLDSLKDFQYWPIKEFTGKSECFKNNSIKNLVIEYMNTDSKQRNTDAPNELVYKVTSMLIPKRITDEKERHLLILAKCKEKKSD